MGSGVAAATPPVALRIKYVNPPPTPRKITNRSRTIGMLRVTSGIRLPLMAGSCFAFPESFEVVLNTVPHTRQRGASSFTLVPQVGHSLVGAVGFSIIAGIIPAFQDKMPEKKHICSCVILSRYGTS